MRFVSGISGLSLSLSLSLSRSLALSLSLPPARPSTAVAAPPPLLPVWNGCIPASACGPLRIENNGLPHDTGLSLLSLSPSLPLSLSLSRSLSLFRFLSLTVSCVCVCLCVCVYLYVYVYVCIYYDTYIPLYTSPSLSFCSGCVLSHSKPFLTPTFTPPSPFLPHSLSVYSSLPTYLPPFYLRLSLPPSLSLSLSLSPVFSLPPFPSLSLSLSFSFCSSFSSSEALSLSLRLPLPLLPSNCLSFYLSLHIYLAIKRMFIEQQLLVK